MRLLIYLAQQPERLCTIAEVAGSYTISEAHLMKITHQLGLAGWIATTRGKGGGIRMTREPKDIVLGAVVRTTEPDFFIVECFSTQSNCALTGTCKLTGVMDGALRSFMQYLDGHTLADILPARPTRPPPTSSTSGARRGRARPDAAHLPGCAVLALGGYASAAWLTHDFQVWTAEGARRLEVALSPVAAPPVRIEGPGVAAQPLPQLLADGQSVTIVDFIYTRCQTVCLSLGSVYQQMQATLADGPRHDAAAGRVRLLSISFDGRDQVGTCEPTRRG